MGEYTRNCVRDDRETEIEVTFEVESWGCSASYWDPGESAELYIIRATLLDSDTAVELTDAERDRIETEIHENLADYEDHGPDPDDWRDAEIDRRLCEGDSK